MSRVSVKGVLIGGVVDVVSSVVLGLPFAFYAMSKIDLSQTRVPGAGCPIHAHLLRMSGTPRRVRVRPAASR